MDDRQLEIGYKFFDLETKYGSKSNFIAPIEPPVKGSIPISTRTELEAISENLRKKYHLTADIDLEGTEWVPIGTDKNPFAGVFDGQGFEIKNLKIADGSGLGIGLFSSSGEKAIIKNIGLNRTDIIGPVYIGGICGQNRGVIDNCYGKGQVISSGISSFVGGVCGVNNGSISNCYNMGKISAHSKTNMSGPSAGGICGHNNRGNVSNCYNTGPIFSSGTESGAGGICGSSNDPITNCFNTGKVSVAGTWTKAGGICGNSDTVDNCFNKGLVSASGDFAGAGGICGNNNKLTTNSYNTGKVASSGEVSIAGGICASNGSGSTLNNCLNMSKVSASRSWSSAGGICGVCHGYEHEENIVENCYNAGELSASGKRSSAGGICGHNRAPKYAIGACYCLDLYNSTDGIVDTPKKIKTMIARAGFNME